MTSLVLRAAVPCVTCGYRQPVAHFVSVRVLVRTIRQTGTGLGIGTGRCPECGTNNHRVSLPTSWQLDAADEAKVDAARAKLKARRKAV